MARRITVGIDIGTYQVKVAVAEHSSENSRGIPKILGTGIAESKGLRHGYIINSSDIIRSIETAARAAEKSSGIKIKKAYLSVGGVGLDEVHSKGETVVSRADSEVTDLDVDKAIAASEQKIQNKLVNRKVLHTIPLVFRLDGEKVLGKPQGMKGSRLEVEVLFITCLEQHLNDMVSTVEEAGIEVEDFMASPLAGSLITLSKAQKVAGCVLANVGAETVSIVIFENSIPVSLKVFPIGSTDITNDIALGLRISIEEAEQVKMGAITGATYSKKKLDEIVIARLSDIFELIEAHLKRVGRNGLLPAGIIISGGGSGIATIEDLAKAALKIPSKKANIHFGDPGKVKDSTWAVSYGLCLWGITGEDDAQGLKLAKKTGGDILTWVKQFLP